MSYFVSHSWRSPQYTKFSALVLHFNGRAALAVYLLATLVAFYKAPQPTPFGYDSRSEI